MTKQEFDLINRLASQLQHFVDGDGLQAHATELHELLNSAEDYLQIARVTLIRERDYGHSQGSN